MKIDSVKASRHFRLGECFLHILFTAVIMFACICIGSVDIPLKETFEVLIGANSQGGFAPMILSIRLPRVLCVSLVGAALSLCGAAMQGLLKNPLADGSTLGVSSGASLGAALSLAFGVSVPGLPYAGTMLTAMLFAFLSLVLILLLAYFLDKSLSTNSIILIGVIYSMFVSSLISLVISFAGEKVKAITFWSMGSFASSNMTHAAILACALIVCGALLFHYSEELNAFSVGEDNARHVGVNVRKVKIVIMIVVSALIGICVSVSGTIGFVGLVIPHITRMLTGPNHKRLLPATLFIGADFLLLADLLARVIVRPVELSVGVVTSFIGTIVFVIIFYRTRKCR